VEQGTPMPDMYLRRSDGTSLELADLRRETHGLLVLADRHLPTVHAFVDHFQANARTFEWLRLKLLVVYKRQQDVPTPWPAPAFPALLAPQELPHSLEWGKAYLFGLAGYVEEVYNDLDLLAVNQVERDLGYWETNKCG